MSVGKERFFKGLSIDEFRKEVWESSDGRKIPVECLEDTHLANIIRHCRGYNRWNTSYSPSLVRSLEREASRRGLTSNFIKRAPIPYRTVSGKWNM